MKPGHSLQNSITSLRVEERLIAPTPERVKQPSDEALDGLAEERVVNPSAGGQGGLPNQRGSS